MKTIVTFGEIMLRLSSPLGERLPQARTLNVVYGGAEANVAVSLARFGRSARYLSRMPADNPLTQGCLEQLRQSGVDVDHIPFGGDRFGVYFIDSGSGPRPTQVTYDRANSGFATLEPGMINWSAAFTGAGDFYWSGISPAVSASAAAATAEGVAAAKEAGLAITCDLNYRHKLWQWGKRPHAVMPALIAQCDTLIGNSAAMMVDVNLPASQLTPDSFAEHAQPLADQFPNLKRIVMTCRSALANENDAMTAMMWQTGEIFVGRSIEISGVIDSDRERRRLFGRIALWLGTAGRTGRSARVEPHLCHAPPPC